VRILLLGAGGKLGHDIRVTAPPDVDLIPYSRQTLDITDSRALSEAIRDGAPDCIINAAAYTAVDEAEREQDLAYRVNAGAVRTLGELAHERSIHVVHFSTDHVFAGSGGAPYSEDDPCDPVNVYGASKLAGERGLAESRCRALVVRTQWLFGIAGRSFARTMLERARAQLETRVVTDQYGRPTYTRHVAGAIWPLVARGQCGLMHITNDGSGTWFDVAHEIFAREGQTRLLSSCTTAEYPTLARRPPDSRLATGRFESERGRLPAWRAALAQFLTECDGRADALSS